MRVRRVLAVIVGLVACDGATKSTSVPFAPTDGGAVKIGTASDGGDPDAQADDGDDDVDVPVPVDPDAGVTDTAMDGGAGLPVSQRFDLATPSSDLFRAKPLHENRVMQSIAFDNVNGRLFAAQLQEGSSGDDLCINQLDLSGNLVGSMDLNGAGHGVSIGVESVGADSYLWVETDSSNPTETGRGTAVLRFKFVNGGTPSGTKFLTGSNTITVATDPINERLVVRRIESGKFYYSVFSLEDAAKGDFSAPIVHFPQPALSTAAVTFQGYTIYGQYLYTLDGTSYEESPEINSYVTAIDMNTGLVKSRALTKAGSTLPFREPEGLAIYRTAAGETRLFLGFSSDNVQGGTLRYADVFYKNVLID